MRDDEHTIAQPDHDRMVRADEILWTLKPTDSLTLDDEMSWLADTLKIAIAQVQALTVQCDRQSARIAALVGELRVTRADAQALRSQLRAMDNEAA